ncbi:MAG TPA: hypothetical protein PK819_08845 [Thermomicrobiales bacterium]|nr:hypothetical protein [Thermomicrobiales bacterium]
MARATEATGGPGKFAGAKEMYSLIRGMSISEIEDAVREPPQVLVVSRDATADVLIGEITGVRGTPSVTFVSPESLPRHLDRYALIIVHNPDSNADFLHVRERAGLAAYRTFDIGGAEDPRAIPALRDRIADQLGEDAVALARWYPAFRTAAAREVINDTSRVNAQFALLSAAPTFIPVIGELASVGADLIVLTKNQLMMAVKLAAIYGKPLDNKWEVFRDLTPVIGGGFIWRTLAREAVGILPFAAGTIPKVSIAYAGTTATGRAVEAYYRYGIKTSRDQLTGYFRTALTSAKSRLGNLPQLPGRAGPSATSLPSADQIEDTAV